MKLKMLPPVAWQILQKWGLGPRGRAGGGLQLPIITLIVSCKNYCLYILHDSCGQIKTSSSNNKWVWVRLLVFSPFTEKFIIFLPASSLPREINFFPWFTILFYVGLLLHLSSISVNSQFGGVKIAFTSPSITTSAFFYIGICSPLSALQQKCYLHISMYLMDQCPTPERVK